MRFAIPLLLLLLPACTQARIYSDTAVRATQDAKDISAEILSEAPCAMGLGAYDRLNASMEKKRAIAALCLENTLPLLRSP